ncbi:GDSL-type esterase/lipase family protein [Marinobacter lacisalsi]|uniref:GDSL-type esterase/lipase family protein n=1 Tax=Marinobacter lacisalsi TaxID=475979 RepID=A0ABV8QK96_9GAMM
MRRVIRFKEWGCDQATMKRPGEAQLSSATSSLKDRDYTLNTDVNGFIINGLLNDRDKRSNELILLGDSFVESLFVREDKRINAIIERLSPNSSVINGGYSGSTSLHLINIILNKVIPLYPDYVVVFVPTNDQRIQSLENGYWCRDSRLSPLVPLGRGKILTDNYKDRVELRSVYKALRVINVLLATYNIKHCFATTPHRQNVAADDEWAKKVGIDLKRYHRKVTQRRAVNDVCRDFCNENHIDLIDLESEVYDSSFFYDDLHLTERASEVVGGILFRELTRNAAL